MLSIDQLLIAQMVVISVVSLGVLIAATVASWLMLRESRLMLRDVLDLVPDESLEWTDVGHLQPHAQRNQPLQPQHQGCDGPLGPFVIG